MDFGYFRGPKHLTDLTNRTWHGKRRMMKQEAADYQPIITSDDVCSSYLLVVDAFTRASFVFLTKSKSSPIDTITMFLDKYDITDTNDRFYASSAPIKAESLLVRKHSGKWPKSTTILLFLKQQEQITLHKMDKVNALTGHMAIWSDVSFTVALSALSFGVTPSCTHVISLTGLTIQQSKRYHMKHGGGA